VDTKFDHKGDKVKHMGSLMGSVEIKVQRSDGEDNPSQEEDSLLMSPGRPSHSSGVS